MSTKRILEQGNQDPKYNDFSNVDKEKQIPTTGTALDLRQAFKLGCFNYQWLTLDPAPQPKTITGNKLAITGKNKNNEQVFIYGDGTAKNNVTGKTLRWSCPKLVEQTNSVLSKFGLTKDDEEKAQAFTEKLKVYVDKGSVSDVFDQWNKMLSVNFPNINRLNVKPEIQKVLFDTSELNANYIQVPGLDKEFPGATNIVIWQPKKELNTVTVQAKDNLIVAKCTKQLINYVVSAIQANAGIAPILDTTQILRYQTDLQRCWANNAYAKFPGIKEEDVTKLTKELSPFGFFKMGNKLSFDNIKKILRGETKYLTPKNAYAYIFTIDERAQNESKLDNLDSLIKENLMISLNEKKKTILTENKIITNRLNVLIEGGIPKTKKGQEKFINEVINEAISLNSQGLDKDLIKENFWDTIKGLFGNYAGGGLVETFKEKFMKYLIGKLTPADPDGWTVGVIEKAFGNIPVSDYFNGKILECNYLTHILTKSIVEETIAKAGKSSAGQKIGGGSVIFDVLRNSIINQLDNTDFAKNIEHGLASFVCPAIQGISGKMEKAANQIKDKALKP